MVLLSLALLPSLWLNPTGALQGANTYRLAPGVQTERGPRGAVVYNFDGRQGGIAVPEIAGLRGARSLTVSAWAWLRQIPERPGQIAFRGDERDAFDAFSLVVWPDGSVHFGIGDDRSDGVDVGASMPVSRWTHVTGTLDAREGKIRLYLDGKLVQEKATSVRPIGELDERESPGIGIGNVQNPLGGRHNQPFDGKLGDVRIYPFVVSPRDAGYAPEGWNVPWGLREIPCG